MKFPEFLQFTQCMRSIAKKEEKCRLYGTLCVLVLIQKVRAKICLVMARSDPELSTSCMFETDTFQLSSKIGLTMSEQSERIKEMGNWSETHREEEMLQRLVKLVGNALEMSLNAKAVEDTFQWVTDKASLSMDDRLFRPLKD